MSMSEPLAIHPSYIDNKRPFYRLKFVRLRLPEGRTAK